jgi:hypothetical protein
MQAFSSGQFLRHCRVCTPCAFSQSRRILCSISQSRRILCSCDDLQAILLPQGHPCPCLNMRPFFGQACSWEQLGAEGRKRGMWWRDRPDSWSFVFLKGAHFFQLRFTTTRPRVERELMLFEWCLAIAPTSSASFGIGFQQLRLLTPGCQHVAKSLMVCRLLCRFDSRCDLLIFFKQYDGAVIASIQGVGKFDRVSGFIVRGFWLLHQDQQPAGV